MCGNVLWLLCVKWYHNAITVYPGVKPAEKQFWNPLKARKVLSIVRLSKTVSLTWSSLWNWKIKLIPYRYSILKRLYTCSPNSQRTCRLWSLARTHFLTRCSFIHSLSSLFFPLSPLFGALLYWVFDVGFGWGHCSSESKRTPRPLGSQAVSF